MPRIILGIYLIVGGLNIYARYFDLHDLHIYTKPLLMPLLIYYLYRYADGNITLPRMLLTGALLFSWIGDLLLMGAGDLYFLGGLGAFLIAHIFYSITFYKSVMEKPKLNILYLIPLGVFGYFYTTCCNTRCGVIWPLESLYTPLGYSQWLFWPVLGGRSRVR